MDEIITANETNIATSAPQTMISVNFDPESMEGKKRLFNAFNNPDSLADYMAAGNGDTVTFSGLSVRPFTQVDQATGEVTEGLETVFMLDDGTNLFSRSFGIGRSAVNLLNACSGKLPGAVTVKITETKLDAKRTLKGFEWV